jgi:cell wall-associated NlpC family hydrolase
MITKPEDDGFDQTAYTDLSSPPPFSARLMAEQAMNLLTVPYVWGGKTAFGLDCSGLVQFLFQKQGYSFPRDAWQQAEKGKEISFDHSKPEFEEGDLLFFQHPGKKIHHVAISLGGSRYIHASEWVQINSLNEQNTDFRKERRDTFINAKKIQPETLVSLLDSFRKL